MAFIIKDRVKESTTSTGTGAITLGGAAATFDTFQSYMTNGDTTYYAIVHTTSGVDEWEVGLGTWNTGNTLTRTTVLAGSNGTSAQDFAAGSKDVFMTYPAAHAALAEDDVTFANITVTGNVDGRDVAADGTKLDTVEQNADVTDAVNVAAAGALMRAGGTMTGNLILNADPAAALGAATKQYVDTIASAGIHYHTPVRAEHPSNLNATYSNGSSGVGATLTNAGTNAALVIDSVSMVLNDRVLVANQTTQTQNGVYTVTTVGDGSTAWVLTRSTDTDTAAPSDPDAFGKGDAFFIKEGATNAGHLDVLSTSGTIVFGTTNIVFSEVAETTVYSGGTGITLTGTTFAIGQDVGTTSNVTFNQVTAAIIGNVTGDVTGDVTGNAATATTLETSRTIQLTGDVTGSATFDGSANASITAVVQDDSHSHVISNVDGLQTALDAKAPTSRTITAGNGLTGGGDLTANRTLTVGGGTGITVNANDIAIDSSYTGFDSRYVNTAGDTMSGALTVSSSGSGRNITLKDSDSSGTAATPWLQFKDSGNTDLGYVGLGSSSSHDILLYTNNGNPVIGGNSSSVAKFYKGGTYYNIFHDDYHPNADKWTLARTLTLTGDVTGSVSWDGSGNASISTVVGNNSHTHTTLSTVNFNNGALNNVNNITFNDPGPNEGLEWLGGSGWKIYESPDNLTTNSGGNLQFVQGSTREMTLNTSGSLYTAAQGVLWGASNDGSGSGLDADLLDGVHSSNFARKSGLGSSNYYSVDNWLEFYTTGTGMFWNGSTGAGWHIYPASTQDMYFRSGHASYVGLRLTCNNTTARGYLFANTSNEVGILDAGRDWAIKHRNDLGTYFYTDGSTEEFKVGRDAVTGNYGTVQTTTSRAGWGGYSIKGNWVFMASDDNATTGIYNDMENEWGLLARRNAEVELYYNGSLALETVSTGIRVSSTTSSDIYMQDTNDGERRIHCNSNRLGFLNSSSAWSFYSTDAGDVESVYGASFGTGSLSADGQNDVFMFASSATSGVAQAGAFHNKLRILGGSGQSRDLQLYQIDSEYAHIGSSWSSNQLIIDSNFSLTTFSQPIVITDPADEKIKLSGSSQPYIRWQEGTTNKFYIQWRSGEGAPLFQNQEGDNFDFMPDAATGAINLRLRGSDNDIWGSVYADDNSNVGRVGFLDDDQNWAYRITSDVSHEWLVNDSLKLTLSTSALKLDCGTSSTLDVKCDDGGLSLIRANGDNQGTGAIEVGQSNTYGGGISYNGDGSPSFVSGESADYITFYRLSNGTRTEVISYAHNSNTVYFNGDLHVPNKIYHSGDTNTYTEFHAADQWRVVTGGSERLEVNNTQITSTEPIHAPSFHGSGANLTNLPASGSGSVGAWVNFNGTGTIAIRDSGNVTALYDQAAGKYGCYIGTSVAADYALLVSATAPSGWGMQGNGTPLSNTVPGTTFFKVSTGNTINATYSDFPHIYAACIE